MPVESFLPLVHVEREWSDRRKSVALPLFPGYLFVRCAPGDLVAVLRTPGVVDAVRFDGDPVPVRPEEIDAVRALLRGVERSGVLPTAADYLDVGDAVRVVEGPFAGLEGVLVEHRGSVRIVVRLRALRQAVGVEMERAHVRPVTDTKRTSSNR